MSVRIDSIDIKSLGPLQDFQHELKDVNLVYGKNETGKTHLVEFLIRSLFKHASYPGMRNPDCVGRLTVSGLADSPIYFAPGQRRKLEDFINEDGKALPANISRLLVVRGGELSLADNQIEGIDRGILEEYLSNSGVINQVRENIQKSVQNAGIIEGRIDGRIQGKIKERADLSAELANIDRLIDRVNAEYASGVRASLQVDLTSLQVAFEDQKQARCHYAYQLDEEIKSLDTQLDNVPEEILARTRIDFHDFQSSSANLLKCRQEFEKESSACRDLPWLRSAAQEYQVLVDQHRALARPWLLILSAVMLAAAIALIFFRQSLPAVLLIAAAAMTGFFYYRTVQEATAQALQSTELEKIVQEFEERFNRPLTNLAGLQEVVKDQERAETTAQKLERDTNELESEISRLTETISDQLYRLTGKRHPAENWRAEIDAVNQRRREIRSRSDQLKLDLASLQVDRIDFRSEPATVIYNEQTYRVLGKHSEEIKEKLRQEDDRLNSLKQRLAGSTGQDISTSCEKLIEKLQEMRAETAQDYQEVSAYVIGGILLNQTLDRLFAEEEKSIQAGLLSPGMSKFVKQMTTHYERVEYENDAIRIADPFSEYAFGDLSTATQEQVLLALRLGFAARCFHNQSLFLVLDDAFQHSDWTRREYLVDEVLDLAQKGWQILYLTMDDHIRSLFKEKALALSGKGFLEICL